MDQYRNMPVLVTGGAGFIGSHLTRGLLAAGARVRVMDDLSHGSAENVRSLGAQIEFHQADITDAQACQKAVDGREVVFHLAALGSVPGSVDRPVKYNAVNGVGTLNMLEAARQAGAKRFVFSASSSAYGDTPVLPKIESMAPAPKSPYAVGKLIGEYYCRVYAEVYGLATMSLRYFNVFGPRQNPKSQYAAVIPAFVSQLLAGERPKIYGDGEQTRDFCFVENVVYANMLAGSGKTACRGEVANIACGQNIGLNAMLKEMQAILKTDIRPEYLPPRAGDVRDSLADISAAKKLLGYAPKVFFDAGLKQTVEWYAANRK